MAMYDSIVVGTDGSPTATRAVRRAAALAACTGARVDLVSAYRPVPEREVREGRAEAPGDVQWAVTSHSEVDQTLSDAADLVREAGAVAAVHRREDDPAHAIMDVAEEQGAGLIIVGSVGMTGARRFLPGSVPNKVAHNADCDVMIVHTT